MTDNEIIKALKCCTGDLEGCASCPLYDHPCDMGHKLNYYALDLINRQKAEIERLERHTEMYHEVRAEAVKEFADRLTDKADLKVINAFESSWVISQELIDNLVKEMVGENNAPCN